MDLKLKKAISAAISLSIVASSFPISVFADNKDETAVASENAETVIKTEDTQSEERSEETEIEEKITEETVEEALYNENTEYSEENEEISLYAADMDVNAPISTIYENDFSGDKANVVEYQTGVTSVAQDPKNSKNMVLKMSAVGTSNAETNYNVALTDKDSTSYENRGYIADRPIVYEVKLYIPDDFINGDSDWGYNGFFVGPTFSGNNEWPVQGKKAYTLGINNYNGYGGGNAGSGYAFITENKWGDHKQKITTDAWHDLKWVIKGTGADTKVSMWVDGAKVVTDATAEKKFDPSLRMEGIRLAQKGATKIADGVTLYADDVKIYQVKTMDAEFEVDDTQNVDMTKGIIVDLKHEIPVENLSEAFTIEKDGEEVAKAKVSAIEGEKTKYLITSDILEGSTEYMIYFEGYTNSNILYTNKNSIGIKTAMPTSMKVSADLANNATLEAGANSVNLSFSMPVSAESVKAATTVTDEDGIVQEISTEQIDEKVVKINMNLGELCGFTLKVSDSLQSATEAKLPLDGEFTLSFRTKAAVYVPEEDPYEKPTHGDSNVLTSEQVQNKSGWYLSDSINAGVEAIENGAKVSVSNSDASVMAIPNAKKSDDYYENQSGKYEHASCFEYEYDLKLPDLSTIQSFTNKALFHITSDHAKDTEWKDIGAWGVNLVLTYNDKGISVQKEDAGSSMVKLYTADEMAGKTDLHIKFTADVQTGMITFEREDGEIRTVNMNASVNWGDTSYYKNWSPYMYVRNLQFNCKAAKRQTAEFEVTNLSIRRVTKSLGVENANFSHDEYYVDTDNMELTFNEEIDIEDLKKSIYITDENGNKVTDCTIEVTGDSKDFNVSVTGLESYTRYNMNIEGIKSVNGRMMSESFTRGFVTQKSNEVFVDTKDTNATLNTHGNRLPKATEIDYNLVIKNGGENAKEMIGAVAAYDENDGLLKIEYKDVTVGTNSFKLENIPSGTARVKAFVWEKTADGGIGKLLHEPDTLKEENAKKTYTLKYEKTLPAFDNGVADSSNSIIYISGMAKEADKVYTILVLDGENTPITEANTKTLALVYGKTTQNGENIVYGDSFAFASPTGKYTAYVITDEGASKQEIEFIKLADLVEEFIKPLSAGKVAQNTVYSKTNQYNAAIGVDFTKDFVSERDKALFEKRMYERRSLLVGPTDLDYINQLNENIEFAKAEIKYLNELKAISYEGLIEEKLRNGTEYTKISFTAYERLNSNQKAAVRATLLGVEFADGDAVKNAFDKGVANPPKTPINTTPSVSTGTGTGSGGGKGSVTSVPQNVIKPQKEVTADDVFNDIANYTWAKDAILYLAKRNIINGTEKNKFTPAGFVTREQFSKMAVLAAGAYNENASADFTDVDISSWYAVYVASAKKKGLINGVSDTEFGVGRNITRQEMATVIYRALKNAGYSFTTEKKTFTDMADIDEYAMEAVQVLGAEGIIKGMEDGSFAPKKYATRAEAAILIKALAEGVN